MSTRPFALVCDVKSNAIEPYIIVSEHGSTVIWVLKQVNPKKKIENKHNKHDPYADT